MSLTSEQTKITQKKNLNKEEEEAAACIYAMQLATASSFQGILKSAIELGLLEIIARSGEGAYISPSDIASQLPTKNPDAPVMIDRMLRLLASYKVLMCKLRTCDEEGQVERLYGLAPVCKFFVENKDGVSMAPLLLLNQDKVWRDSWDHMNEAILDGGVPFIKAHAMPVYKYQGTDPRFNKVFNKAMSDHSTITMKKILEIYKGFEGLNSIVDVAGGIGSTINMIVSKYTSIQGINFDLPHVVEVAPSYPGVECSTTVRDTYKEVCFAPSRESIRNLLSSLDRNPSSESSDFEEEKRGVREAKGSSSDSSMDEPVIPTEDVVHALLSFLVDTPIPLRDRSSSATTPTPAQQEKIAKQMHAVVLLYNHYHRKQYPHLEFLDFESFCKVIVNAKPYLLVYMGFMQRCSSESKGLEEVLSVTEKAIVDACNICLGLDASRDMEKWPISKVVVFLVDKKKQNCLVLYEHITLGIWSAIEKNIDDSNDKPGDRSKVRKIDENKSATEVNFDQLAFSAVKEQTGIDQTDLMILESHVVPSLSSAKTAARFYLLRRTKTVAKDVIEFPLEEVINSLQGPLVMPISPRLNGETSVVKNLHLLPYAGILSDWFSRTGQENEIMESSPTRNHSCTIDDGSSDILGNKTSDTDTLNLDNFTRGYTEEEMAARSLLIKGKIKSNQKKRKFFIKDDPSITKKDCKFKVDKVDKVVSVKELCNNRRSGAKAADGNDNGNARLPVQDRTPSADHPVLSQTHSEGPDRIHAILSSKGNALLNPAVEALHKKKEELVDKVDKVVSVKEPCNNKRSGAKAADGNDNGNARLPVQDRTPSADHPVLSQTHSEGPDKIHAILSSKGNALLNPAVEALHKKKEELVVKEPCNNRRSGAKAADGNDNGNARLPVQDRTPSADHPVLVLSQSHSEGPDKIHAILSSKRDALLKAAVRALHKKREELTKQQRNLQDKIDLCEQNLQKILSGGDDLMLKLECIIEACNIECYTRCTGSHMNTHQNSEEGNTSHMKMNKLSEAILCLRNPCQDLDEICCKNNWAFPRYNVLPTNGGFQAKVTLKGVDFEFSVGGEPHAGPREARGSAAAKMLTKLRSPAGPSNPN